MCDFLEEIACHKTFSAHFLRKSPATKLFRPISSGNRPPQTFSAHFLRKSAATKLFRLISSGNRSPQTFSAHFLRKSAATKLFQPISSGNRSPQTFSAHFLRKLLATKLFRLISSGNRWDGLPLISSGNRWMGFHSFPQEIVGWPTSNSRYSYVKRTLYRLKQPLHSPSLAIDRQNGITPPGRSVEKLRH